MIRRRHDLLPVAMILAACATAARQPATPPTDVEWRLIELEGAPVVASPGGRGPQLRFAAEGTRVTGFTTCNSLFGSYEAPGDGRVRFTQLGSTKMACVEPERAQQEQRFLSVLQRVDRFTVAGDTLTLFGNDRPVSRFVAAR